MVLGIRDLADPQPAATPKAPGIRDLAEPTAGLPTL